MPPLSSLYTGTILDPDGVSVVQKFDECFPTFETFSLELLWEKTEGRANTPVVMLSEGIGYKNLSNNVEANKVLY